ncbi:hypothetical protein FACS189449_11460 [Alphaproteobacteria bacterium]|nr:hypothetical protein FACS189449_11460 [Alphaproteobacteria bacterium]
MRNLFKILIVFAVLSADTLLAGTSKPPPQNAPKIKTEDLVSPIGNMWQSEIYSFIQEYILDRNKDKYYTEDPQELVKRELEIEHENRKKTEYTPMKPRYACVMEMEMSDILRVLCRANPWCYEITLFTKNGVSFASSGGCRHPVFEEDKDDVYEHLGFLYPDPSKYVKTKRLTRISDNATYFRITKAIYLSKNGGMYFLKKNDPQDEIVGYISYIVHPVYFEIGDDDYEKRMAKYGLK